MEISKDTIEVLNFLDYISDNSLRKRADIGVILEIGASAGDYDNVNNIILYGTSLWTLYQTVKKHQANPSASDLLVVEMNKSADTLIDGLKKISVNSSDPELTRFDEVYFSASEGSFRNLVDLAHDLNILKKLQTDMQKKIKN